MSTNEAHNGVENPALAQSNGNGTLGGGVAHRDFEKATQHMSHEEKHKAVNAARFGYGPLARFNTNDSSVLPGR